MKGSCDTISAGHRQQILFLLTERGERFPLFSPSKRRGPLYVEHAEGGEGKAKKPKTRTSAIPTTKMDR